MERSLLGSEPNISTLPGVGTGLKPRRDEAVGVVHEEEKALAVSEELRKLAAHKIIESAPLAALCRFKDRRALFP
jgi:hypothetical protein